jgi:mono/diheme cytochrome c family protein
MPSRKTKLALAFTLTLAGVGTFLLLGFLRHGFSARAEPWAVEAWAARHLRRLAIPRGAREASNPLPASPEALAEARAHFADHCASCHANDGSGETGLGRSFYPKAPDMRLPSTQDLSDGELFYIIENGIRFTGMPAWGRESPEDDEDSWGLVHFIRHLPNLAPEEVSEMEDLNPKTRRELEEEERVRRFLSGEDAPEPRGHEH